MAVAGGRISRPAARFLRFLLPGLPTDDVPHPPYLDSSIKPGSTYWYRVAAWDGTSYSRASDPFSARTRDSLDPSIRVRINAARSMGRLDHKWESAINIADLGPLINGPTNDLQHQADQILRDEIGVKYIRTLGILADGMGTYRENPDGTAIYDWRGIDRVYDSLLGDKLKPWVVISFMPVALAANPKQYMASKATISSPPKDYAKWAALVKAFAQHLVDRFGRGEVEQWYFEVWEEPDLHLSFANMWHGTLEDYFQMYDLSATALKSVDARLRVGGPVAASPPTIESFLQHVARSHAPLDFISIHIYGTPSPDWKPLLERHGLASLPVYYSEWGMSGREGEVVNDLPYGAAWVANAVMESNASLDLSAYWTGSEYSVDPKQKKFFHGGFGLLGANNIRKPRFWAYAMLHRLGDEQLSLEGDGDGFGTLIHVWGTRSADGTLRALFANATYNQSLASGSALLSRHVNVEIEGFPAGAGLRIRHYRVDNDHSNAFGAWKTMGSPAAPDASQLLELQRRAGLDSAEPERRLKADSLGRVRLSFQLPMPAVSLVEISSE